jgi:hypothetical protein
MIDSIKSYVHLTVSELSVDSYAHFGISFIQNLYANYKNSEKLDASSNLNYFINPDEFNKFIQKKIKKSNLSFSFV